MLRLADKESGQEGKDSRAAVKGQCGVCRWQQRGRCRGDAPFLRRGARCLIVKERFVSNSFRGICHSTAMYTPQITFCLHNSQVAAHCGGRDFQRLSQRFYAYHMALTQQPAETFLAYGSQLFCAHSWSKQRNFKHK